MRFDGARGWLRGKGGDIENAVDKEMKRKKLVDK